MPAADTAAVTTTTTMVCLEVHKEVKHTPLAFAAYNLHVSLDDSEDDSLTWAQHSQ